MIYIFSILAAALVIFSYRSFTGGITYLKYVKDELKKPVSDYEPFAAIIVPCKGLDEGLRENLEPLLEQQYARYEVIFVIDDEKDPAAAIIEDLRARSAIETKLVIARKAVYSSQKVENLREAVMHVDPRSEIFVFADSDARPQPGWLASLSAPLEDESVGVATGYRWFISPQPSFAAELRSMWNASIATSLGPRSSFCWAGAMAIRRSTFEGLNVRDRWKGTVSDDFTLATVMKEAGLAIRFVPAALTPSIERCTFREMLEFTTRQIKLARVYSPNLWLMSFVGSALFNTTMVWAIMIILTASFGSLFFVLALTTVMLVTFLSIGKSILRLRAVNLVLKKHQKAVKTQYISQSILWVIAPSIFLYNCIAALFSRNITWRGISYEMVSRTETRVR